MAAKAVGVAVVIPAKDEAARIAATVASAHDIAGVDIVLVVDDGSTDDTRLVARDAGATVVVHERNRGKARALQTGADIVARLDRLRAADGSLPRAMLFVDADLAESAAHSAPLIEPVLTGATDMSIALLPRQQQVAGGHGRVVALARAGIVRATGWTPAQPLSGIRCLTREAFDAAAPLAAGWGVETGLTIDLLRRGFQVAEVPCELFHRVSGADLAGQLHRAGQYRDVARALAARGLLDLRPARGWNALPSRS